MKKILGVCLLLVSFNLLATDINVKVSGMVCSLCAQGIQKKFSGQSAVKSLDVNMDEKVVSIKTHEGKDLSDEVIKTLINEAGYNVAEITRN